MTAQTKQAAQQKIIERQGQEIARLRAAVQEFIEVTNEQGARIVELERELREKCTGDPVRLKLAQDGVRAERVRAGQALLAALAIIGGSRG